MSPSGRAAGLIDLGPVRLSGQPVGVDEPGYDAARAEINPAMIVEVYADTERLRAFQVREGIVAEPGDEPVAD